MDVAVPRVAEEHDREPSRAAAPGDGADVVAHALDRHAGVLDDLERAPLRRQPGEDRARRVPEGPERSAVAAAERAVSTLTPESRTAAAAASTAWSSAAGRTARARPGRRASTVRVGAPAGVDPDQLEEGPVEQLHRRRLDRLQGETTSLSWSSDSSQMPEPGAAGRDRRRGATRLGHEAERALRADDEVEQRRPSRGRRRARSRRSSSAPGGTARRSSAAAAEGAARASADRIGRARGRRAAVAAAELHRPRRPR